MPWLAPRLPVGADGRPLDAARETAIADARRKAETYAKAANVQLGKPVSISEEGSVEPGPSISPLSASRARKRSPARAPG